MYPVLFQSGDYISSVREGYHSLIASIVKWLNSLARYISRRVFNIVINEVDFVVESSVKR